MTKFTGPWTEPNRYRVDAARPADREGGQGFVYKARRECDGLTVALKLLTSLRPGEIDAQFKRAEMVSRVSDPCLVVHVDHFVGPALFDDEPPPQDDFDVPFVVTGWVDGLDLDEIERPDPIVGARLILDVATGARALHQAKGGPIVHRDIKPPNVRVTDEGRAVLIDLGVARPVDSSPMTASLGTDGWRPPEAVNDPARTGPASDMWQIGGLAAWMLTGEPPGRLDHHDLRKTLARAAEQRSVPDSGAAAKHISRALHPDPRRRPTDVYAWADQLVTILSRTRPKRITPGRVLAAAACLALVLIGYTVWAGRPDSRGEDVAVSPSTVTTETSEATLPDPSTLVPLPAPGTVPEAPITVSNLITNGSDMFDDQVAAYLSTRTEPYGKEEFGLPGTDLRPGDQIVAVCWDAGTEMTNGHHGTAADDTNPGLVVSELWYRIRWEDGREGWISEVWIDPDDRGGKDLARCQADPDTADTSDQPVGATSVPTAAAAIDTGAADGQR